MSASMDWDEIAGSNLRSGRDLIAGERLDAFVIDGVSGDVLETIAFTPATPEEAGQYQWPKAFAERINASGKRIRAGEKRADGTFETLASSYRNRLWLMSGSRLQAFTTQPFLDAQTDWSDAGEIRAATDLAAGTVIRVEVRARAQGKLYERLDHTIEPDRNSMYAWPEALSRAINRTSLFLRAGEKDPSTALITPLGSSYRNHLWFPAAAGLTATVEYLSAGSVWDEVEGSNLRSGRDLIVGERLCAFVIDSVTGDILETITFTPATPEEAGQYRWPKAFADRINASGERIRAGEKRADGTFETLASSYRNNLWVRSGFKLQAFTTQPYLDTATDWTDAGPIRADTGLAAGTVIRVEVRSRAQGKLYERLDYAVEADRAGPYAWPEALSKAINRTSLFLRAGEKDLATARIAPLGSSYRNHLWYPASAEIAVNVAYLPVGSSDNDARVLYERAVAEVQVKVPALETVERWLQGFASGRFADIAYPPQQAGANIAPLYEHVERTRAIAALARTVPATDAERFRGAAIAAMKFYTDSDFRTSNWWDRQIGLARPAAQALVLLADSTASTNLGPSVGYLSRTTNTSMGQAGANQADFAYIQLFYSIAGWRSSGDSSFIEQVRTSSAVVSGLCMPVSRHGRERGEGISVDYSFSQHNPKEGTYSQLYAGTYGGVLLSDIFILHKLLPGSLALRRDAIQSLERFLLRGMGWFSYQGTYDFHVCGRAISRGMESSRALANWAKQLLADQPEAPAALEELVRRAGGDESANNIFRGNRAYWVNDYMAHLTPRFAFWSKTVSTRTVGTESGNRENLKGYYVGTGSCLLVKTGNEYRDIQPLWEWQRIPGTTVEQVPDFKYPLVEWGNDAWGSDDFSGAASDGTTGVSSMILTRRNVAGAKKTAFALDDRVIFVGSDIDCRNAVYPVCTSVDQCRFVGDAVITYETGETEHLILGKRISSRRITEIAHGGFRYAFKDKSQSVTVEAVDRTGAWSEINSGRPSDAVSGNLFSIWIDHPPGQPGEYLYQVSAIDDRAADIQVITLPGAHLYLSQDRQYGAGAVFLAGAGRMELGDVVVQPSSSCAFMLKKLDDTYVQLAIADLSQKQVATTFNMTWKNEAARDFLIPFPTGPAAGSTGIWKLSRQGLALKVAS